MEDILKQVAEAAYNGICLEAENGATTHFTADRVSGPTEYTDDIVRIHIQLLDGRKVLVGVMEDK